MIDQMNIEPKKQSHLHDFMEMRWAEFHQNLNFEGMLQPVYFKKENGAQIIKGLANKITIYFNCLFKRNTQIPKFSLHV